MRRAWLGVGHFTVACAALAACKKDPGTERAAAAPVAATPVVVPRDAPVADAPAPPDASAPLTELLHAVPATVRVSSKVKNKAIKPQHLVDRDLQTAWNSMTGDLHGAWVEVEVPEGATVEELRLTVGHTGTGKKGEDYFAMNPRIRRVIVTADGAEQPPIELDPALRALQTIKVHATTSVRVTVEAYVLGAKKAWREIAISELEAWGTPPPGLGPPTKALVPTVEVGEPPDGSGLASLCADLDAERTAYAAKLHDSYEACDREAEEARAGSDENAQEMAEHCMTDYPGEPMCDVADVDITDRAKPWTGLGVHCSANDNIYGPKRCEIAVAASGKVIATLTIDNGGLALSNTHWDVDVFDARVQDVIPGGTPELVLRYRLVDRDDTDHLVVCQPSGCTKPLALAGDGWTVQASFAKGQVVLTPARGAPPPEALGTKPMF